MRAPLALAFLVAAGCAVEPDPPCVAPALHAQQLFAVAGYSGVEARPEVPQQVTLAPNPALVDADVVTSAGVDLGYGLTVAGDTAFRDVAVELGRQPPLSEIWIWVDRALPPEVAASYAWEAFRSDDNAAWTAIPSAGPVRFDTLDDRFEIPLAPTQARYVKVVTRPLAAGVTTDPRFADVRVTEAQGFAYLGGCP